MTFQLFAQAFLAPILLIIVAGFLKKYHALALLVGFWVVSIWVDSPRVQAMDSIAFALTISTVAIYLIDRVKGRWLMVAHFLLLAILSVWQVKNFVMSISVTGWITQAIMLLIAIVLPWWVSHPQKTESHSSFINRFSFSGLFWLIPIGYLSILSPLAGSIIVGQMGGLVAMLGLGMWLYQGFGQSNNCKLAQWIATPTVFVGLMAYHYVLIEWTSLALGLLGWLPLLWKGLNRVPWWLQFIAAGVLFVTLTALGLYIEWPEQSLY